MAAVTIPVMAKCRIGHFVEAQVLRGARRIDYIDESEVLTPADETHHVDKHDFKVPFVCGCRDLGEALRRIGEGAAMIRTKGEAGTGNIVEAVRHMRDGHGRHPPDQEHARGRAMAEAKALGAPVELVQRSPAGRRLPVVNFAAGGIATPADAALMMQLGADGVFVGSGIFKSEDPAPRWRPPSSRRRPTSTTRGSSPTSRRAWARHARPRRWRQSPSAERLATRGW